MDYALFAFAVLLFGLGLYVIFRICEISAQCAAEEAEIRKWRGERAEFRAANPPTLHDESSLEDDYNSILPAEQSHDRGPKAA